MYVYNVYKYVYLDWPDRSWPKGKINEGETPYACGLRETLEETGYNASGLCSEENFLVVHEDSKLTKLFVAVGEQD